MVCDDSEENFLELLDKLNTFHETIKLTYNYSMRCLYRTEKKHLRRISGVFLFATIFVVPFSGLYIHAGMTVKKFC